MISLRGRHQSAQERRLWDSVREVAESVVSTCTPPTGFVRRELPVGDGRVDVWASFASAGPVPTTVVVVVPPADDLPDKSELRRRFGLTPRESEVALLLAERRSNKEVAQALSIAHKTAWRHTARVLSKLGTNSRRDVARVIRRGGPSRGAGS